MKGDRFVDIDKLRNSSLFSDRSDGTGHQRSLAPELASPEKCLPQEPSTDPDGRSREIAGHACTVTLESYVETTSGGNASNGTAVPTTKTYTAIPGSARNVSGMFYKYGTSATGADELLCAVSEGAASRTQASSGDAGFPAVERRPCCTQSEFLFTYAGWTPKKEAFWYVSQLPLAAPPASLASPTACAAAACASAAAASRAAARDVPLDVLLTLLPAFSLRWVQQGVNALIAIMNVAMAVGAMVTWTRWHTSTRFVLVAFAFPFILKFFVFCVPEFEAVDVQPPQMADSFINYEIRQRGFASFEELETSGVRLMTDTARELLMQHTSAQKPPTICPTLYPKSVYEFRDCVDLAIVNPNKTEQPFGCPEYVNLTASKKTSLLAQLGTCDPWGVFQYYASNENLQTFHTYNDIPALGECSGITSNVLGGYGALEIGTKADQMTKFNAYKKFGESTQATQQLDAYGGKYTPVAPSKIGEQGITTLAGELAKYPRGFGRFSVPNNSDICGLWPSIVPTALDFAIPNFFGKAQAEMKNFYILGRNKTEQLAALSVRVKATVTTLSALFPITFALLPGIAKGAKQVKRVLPESALVSCIMAVVPVLQLPLMAVIMGIITQVTGYWLFYVGVLALMVVLVSPTPGLFHALGSHTSNGQYLAQQKVRIFCMPIIVYKLICAGVALAAFALGFLNSGLEADLGLDDVLGDATGKLLGLLGPVLNFFKGRTITTVMSSDIILRTMIALQREDVIHEDTLVEDEPLVVRFRSRMVAGMIAGLTPKRAHKLMEKFDKDGDGAFDEEEIKGMIKELAREDPKYQPVIDPAKAKAKAEEAAKEEGVRAMDVSVVMSAAIATAEA